jgi:peptidoglycan hydrolase-like protein with peptidoglycan-binding domain
MKQLICVTLLVLAMFLSTPAMQDNSQTTTANNASQETTAKPSKKRGPVFRANQDQIKQAQRILKERGFYTGEETGKLDKSTRAGLKKYQESENIKTTGTLNAQTLEKMNIQLTDKQKDLAQNSK